MIGCLKHVLLEEPWVAAAQCRKLLDWKGLEKALTWRGCTPATQQGAAIHSGHISCLVNRIRNPAKASAEALAEIWGVTHPSKAYTSGLGTGSAFSTVAAEASPHQS